MRDQMEYSVVHSQILVAKCDHLVAVWSPASGNANVHTTSQQERGRDVSEDTGRIYTIPFNINGNYLNKVIIICIL